MPSLKDFLEESRAGVDVSMFYPNDNFILSALGARVCYSDTNDFCVLYADPRVSDLGERKAFLERLRKAGHFSVFAHSPVEFMTVDPQPYRKLYKAFIYRNEVCLNGRHLVELTGKLNFFEEDPRIDGFFFADLESGFAFKASSLAELSPYTEKADSYLVGIPIPGIFNWLSVTAFGISRVTSHQWVRHTWQNFSQRSHRYTAVDGFVIPPSFDKLRFRDIPGRLFVENIYTETATAYQIAVNQGIPKEDARYLIPNGARTTLMSSGPYFVWEDFVAKRAVKGAQWEIRRVAEAICRFLSFI